MPKRRTPGLTPPEASLGSALRDTPIWPFRLAALVGAFVGASDELSLRNWQLLVVLAAATIFTVTSWRQPIAYRDDRRTRIVILTEQLCITLGVLATGAWSSPFVLFLVPSSMLGGFAAGGLFSALAAANSALAITLIHWGSFGTRSAIQDGSVWIAILGLVALISGLASRAARDAEAQQAEVLDRVRSLAAANSLLVSLQRVVQSLPATLDIDEVLDSTFAQMRELIRHDAIGIYLVEGDRALLVRRAGNDLVPALWMDHLPTSLRPTLESPRPVRVADTWPRKGLSRTGRSGVYATLRARGAMVGILALEVDAPGVYTEQDVDIAQGLGEALAIAIDNARLFEGIRVVAADEERSRIARELHDHIGSSLALIGFEVDRAISVAQDGGKIEPVLDELRTHVSAVVRDVRNTLFDLRADVSESRGLAGTVADFLEQVSLRSGVEGSVDFGPDTALPLPIERELWQMIREAIVNAERHSAGSAIRVHAANTHEGFVCCVVDNGIGIDVTSPRTDSYGLLGMQERASLVGAVVEAYPRPEGGTEIRIVLPRDPDMPVTRRTQEVPK
ncbi:MAG: histidine kinase [Ilumatobacteraceae bacterium]